MQDHGMINSMRYLQRITLTRGRETRFSSVKRLLPRATRGYVFSKIALALICLLSGIGCQLPWQKEEARYVDPALPMSLNSHELVDYLNGQNQGLEGWRCTSTRMHVRLPNGMGQRLKGAIACQAPRYFRLTASNVIANADLGSNDRRCWVYVKPGESAVMTWRHEDTPLLQQIPTGVPYIDPNWLMLVLGVTPLDPAEYEIRSGPVARPELWLTAIEQSPSGRPLRRVIKVDTIRGVIREHALYDSEANPLVRAQLSQHQSYNGKLIPRSVKLSFPQMDSEISLSFDGIETNPHLPESLWRLPDQNLKVVDLGEVIRARLLAQQGSSYPRASQTYSPPRVRLQEPQFGQNKQSAFAVPDAGSAMQGSDAVETPEEPDWDAPISQTRPLQPVSHVKETLEVPPVRRGFFSWFRRR